MLQSENLITLLHLSFAGANSNQVNNAVDELRSYRKNLKFLPWLQMILKDNHINLNIKTAAANLIRTIARDQVAELQQLKSKEIQINPNEILSTRILHQIQAIYNDLSVQTQYKYPISQGYVRLYLSQNLSNNPSKLIASINYFYKLKEVVLAGLLVQSIQKGREKMSTYMNLYNDVLTNLIEATFFYLVTNQENMNKQKLIVSMETMHILITEITFQKYPIAANKICSSESLKKILTTIMVDTKDNNCIIINNKVIIHLKVLCFQIAYKINNNLSRMRDQHRYQNFINQIEFCSVKLLSSLFGVQLNQYSFECQQINYAISVFLKLVVLQLNNNQMSFMDICDVVNLQQIIGIAYKLIIRNIQYCVNGKMEFNEFMNLWDEICYNFDSQCIQVQITKFISVVFDKSQQFRNFITLIFEKYKQKQSQAQQMSEQQLYPILILPSLLIKLFMKDIQLQHQLQCIILSQNHKLFKNYRTIALYFLLYANFSDEIFLEDDSIYLKIIQLLDSMTDQFLKDIFHRIIKDYLEKGYPFSTEQLKVKNLLKVIQQKIGSLKIQDFYPILKLLLKNYNKYIPVDFFLNVINNFNHQRSVLNFLDFVEEFFKVQEFQSYFLIILDQLRIIFVSLNINDKQIAENSSFFSILKSVIQIFKQIPKDYESILFKFAVNLKEQETAETLNLILIYSSQDPNKDRQLVQHLMEECLDSISLFRETIYYTSESQRLQSIQMQIHSLLLIHIGIYYHHSKLSLGYIQNLITVVHKVLQNKKKQFNYRTGKYQIIIILLLHYEFDRIKSIFNSFKNLDNNKIEEQLYDFIYQRENAYRVQYESSIFVSSQLYILKHYIADEMQLKYSHISLLAVIWNLCRMYNQQINDQQLDCFSESNQSLVAETLIEKQAKLAQKIYSYTIFPPTFKQINQFHLFNEFIKNIQTHQVTKRWYKDMVERYMHEETKKKIKFFGNICKVNGNYRKILKIQQKI